MSLLVRVANATVYPSPRFAFSEEMEMQELVGEVPKELRSAIGLVYATELCDAVRISEPVKGLSDTLARRLMERFPRLAWLGENDSALFRKIGVTSSWQIFVKRQVR